MSRKSTIAHRIGAFVSLMRRAQLPRASHGLAHLCVCAVVLFSWSLPGGVGRRPAPVTFSPGEDEVDAALQRAAVSALGGREGTVVVLDAQTGRLRALVNARLAFESATPPGSTVKPFTVLAALGDGVLDEESRMLCRGRYRHDDFKIACSHPRFKPPFGPAQALANSCNYFYGRVGESLSGESFRRALASFGFGATTRSADERETPGSLPREGLRVADMLGESERLLVTPAQLVTAYAALFNGGRLFVPQRAPSEGFTPRERARVEVAPAHRALLLAGMRGAVAYGTASRAGLSTLTPHVFGKTGTATPPDGFRPQGWFVGFASDSAAESEQPPSVRLAVLVFLRRGTGADAADAARPVFETYASHLQRKEEARTKEQRDGEHDSSPSRSGPSSSRLSDSQLSVRLARADATVRLSLDDYVFGVLAAEASVETELEALKAQAVVSRTYALRNLRRHARDGYDLCDSTHCQRFAPVFDEGARPEFYDLARRAVRETAGEVLDDTTGRVAEAYFSASCGGMTADVARLWGVARPPSQLRGVRDEACAGAANDGWTNVIPAEQLLRALRADERSDVGARLEGVRVVRRDPTGRAELVALEGERRRVLRGWDFKIIVGRTLGWNVLKSSRFDVARAGGDFVFRGRGFGHGLGLCQAGAHAMAGRGATYRQILEKYLPGTSVRGSRVAEFRSPVSENKTLQDQPASESSPPVGEGGHAFFQTAAYHPPSAISLSPASHFSSSADARNRLALSSEHFRVSYPARVARIDVETLLRTLEAARADVLRRLEKASLPPAGLAKTEVFIHETTGDFTGATGQPAWVAAVTRGSRIESQPPDVLRRRGVLATTLRHEFVHVACEAVGRGRAPRWIVEGLAAHVAGEGAMLARAAGDVKLSVEEIERGLARPASAREMRALYAAAYAEVSAIIRREGESVVWRRVASR